MNKTEALEIIKSGHIAECLLAFAMYNGATSISMKEGLWKKEVDKTWTIKCNGKTEEVESVPPLSWYIEFNGWPAGVIGLLGDGVLCAGEAGNEENLRTALLNAIN